jgi:hypothetical protein
VSPQCGFASHEEGNLLGWDDMKNNKLALVRSIADDIWRGESLTAMMQYSCQTRMSTPIHISTH